MARPDLLGTGYIDWVELTRPTRWLGIRDLQWGRVHLPGSTLVFTGVTSRSGERWQRFAHWPELAEGEPLVGSDFRLHSREDTVHAEFPDPPGVLPELVLRPERVLHSGSAVDPMRTPGFFERLAFRVVTGHSQETRWISRAHPAANVEAAEGFAVHEVVRFGR
ncbi:hypothetical protein BH23GEM7_BH23GEM7_21170 [soil metagenome]